MVNIIIEINIFLILSLIGTYLRKNLSDDICKVLEMGILALLYASIMVPASINILFNLRVITYNFKARRSDKARATNQTGGKTTKQVLPD
jgi:hypothetical protein